MQTKSDTFSYSIFHISCVPYFTSFSKSEKENFIKYGEIVSLIFAPKCLIFGDKYQSRSISKLIMVNTSSASCYDRQFPKQSNNVLPTVQG